MAFRGPRSSLYIFIAFLKNFSMYQVSVEVVRLFSSTLELTNILHNYVTCTLQGTTTIAPSLYNQQYITFH